MVDTQPLSLTRLSTGLLGALVDDTVAANMAGTYFNHDYCSPDNPTESLRGLMAMVNNLHLPQDLFCES